jgi:hypothetical protein
VPPSRTISIGVLSIFIQLSTNRTALSITELCVTSISQHKLLGSMTSDHGTRSPVRAPRNNTKRFSASQGVDMNSWFSWRTVFGSVVLAAAFTAGLFALTDRTFSTFGAGPLLCCDDGNLPRVQSAAGSPRQLQVRASEGFTHRALQRSEGAPASRVSTKTAHHFGGRECVAAGGVTTGVLRLR